MDKDTATPKTPKKLIKQEFQKELMESGKSQQVVWLEGKAPEQHNDQPVDITGTISAPRIFIEGREGEFYPKTAHALVSITEGRIKLVVNEHRVDEKYTITGKIEEGKLFKELGINTEKSYDPSELSKKLRLLRSFFKSAGDHTKIVTELRNFNAKVKQELDKKDDKRGNVALNFKQEVESNVPDSFVMKLPLVEGDDPQEITINVIMEAQGASSVEYYLESMDAADILEETKRKIIGDEVEKIKEKVIVINQ